MHEFSITQGILDIALQKAGEADAGKIKDISVTVGELSGVVDDCVRFYFEFLSRDTIAAGASLTLQRAPFKLRCRDCATEFSPEIPPWVCPGCGGLGVEIISGRECYVNSIEVE